MEDDKKRHKKQGGGGKKRCLMPAGRLLTVVRNTPKAEMERKPKNTGEAPSQLTPVMHAMQSQGPKTVTKVQGKKNKT